MRILSATGVLFLVFLLTSCCGSQEEFPSWVKDGAAQAARDHWLDVAGAKKGDWLYKSCGIGYNEEYAVVFRHPRRIIDVDYEGFTGNESIPEHFHDYCEETGDAFGFSIYLEKRLIGSIEVYFQDNEWRLRKITPNSGPDAHDIYEPIYSKYVPSEDVRICQKFDGAFFVTRDGEVKDVFVWNGKTRTYEIVEPIGHMFAEKSRIEESRDSGI